MGHPKKHRKKYESPTKPYDKENLDREKTILKKYGLRRKKEIWRTESILRNYRQRARKLQSGHNEEGKKILLQKLNKIGINVDDMNSVLEVGLDALMDRRLQTVVLKKGFSNSIKHARQIITHGHIVFNERKLNKPSYIISTDIEKGIKVSESIKKGLISKKTEEKIKEKSDEHPKEIHDTKKSDTNNESKETPKEKPVKEVEKK